jgi:PST family polysaccharide transporter/lipopolysaccharide exporter
MIDYGKYIMLNRMEDISIQNIDNIVIGKILGAPILGIYLLAYRYGNYSSKLVTNLIGSVIFPTFAELQDEKERLVRGYLKTFNYVCLLSIPIAIGTIAIAPEFVSFILSEKWSQVIVPLQILSVYGLFNALASPAREIFIAIGKPYINTKILAIQLAIMLLLIVPGAMWYGIIGVCIIVTFSFICYGVLTLLYANQIMLF